MLLAQVMARNYVPSRFIWPVLMAHIVHCVMFYITAFYKMGTKL